MDQADSLADTVSLERLGLARIEIDTGIVFPTPKGVAVFARMYEQDDKAQMIVDKMQASGRSVNDGLVVATLLGFIGSSEAWRVEAAVLQPVLGDARVLGILEGLT